MNNEHGFINRGAGIGGYNNMDKKIELELRRRGYSPRLYTERIGSKKSGHILGRQGETVPAYVAWPVVRAHIMDFQNGDDNNPVNRSVEAHNLKISKKRQYFGPGTLDPKNPPITVREYPDFPKDSDFQNRSNLTLNPEEEVAD